MSVLGGPTRTFADVVDARIRGDRVLAFLEGGNVRIGLERCLPSAVDLAASAIARSVVNVPAVALALPRGHSRVPFIVGLILLSVAFLTVSTIHTCRSPDR